MHTDSPDKLELLGVIRCEEACALEGRLHTKFRKHRSHREWFRPAPEILAYIAKHATPIDKAKPKTLDELLWGNRQITERASAALAAWRG